MLCIYILPSFCTVPAECIEKSILHVLCYIENQSSQFRCILVYNEHGLYSVTCFYALDTFLNVFLISKCLVFWFGKLVLDFHLM